MSGKFGSIEIPSTEIRISSRPYDECGSVTTKVIFTDLDDIKQLYEIAQNNNSLKKTKNCWIKKNQSKSIREIDLKLFDGFGYLVETFRLKGVEIKSFDMEFADEYILDERLVSEFEWTYTSCKFVPNIPALLNV